MNVVKGVLGFMKGNLVVGMLAGSVIGAAAAIIAMPYIKPQLNRIVSKGKTMINTHMGKMTEQDAQ
jgi:gas vesicle protein